jgi:protein-S-isoprenylcysteine O-methyltransferase Ste14/NAD-dependent dihydropyrimidine dehydrogenase PreA subunit
LPIDPNFQKNRKKVGKEEGVAVWGPLDPPEKLGIRGTYVAVDWDICEGCGICLETCPVNMYKWIETSGHRTSKRKAFPVKESDCAQCLACETKCPAQAIRITVGPPSGWNIAVPLFLLQVIMGFAYWALFGPYLELQIPLYFGWFVLAVSLPFFFAPFMYFRRKGRPPQGKSLMLTTVIVESGTYGIVRHPQILGWILLMSASILISQHWLSIVIGVPLIMWFYVGYVPKEEKSLIIKFGDGYKRYMQKVPRMNLLLGIIRLLRRKWEKVNH